MLHKIYKTKNSFNLYKVIPEKPFSYATRNIHGIPLIKIKQHFQNHFLPNANHLMEKATIMVIMF